MPTTAPSNPPIDCFYVYPTVSLQTTPNANLNIDPAETNVAVLQAQRFSQDCRVYAPMYRQMTVPALESGEKGVNQVEAYDDVLNAWQDYLAHYNRGRGVVLIGHSQGSFVLEQLISREIEGNPGVSARLVSAILPGGNVIVPATAPSGAPAPSTTGSSGTTFSHIPPCASRTQNGCVVGYSSFDTTPPANAYFGETSLSGDKVLCVNPVDPAAPLGTAEPLNPYAPTQAVTLLGAKPPAGVATPWITYPDLFTAACEYKNGASWLQINDVRGPGDNRPHLVDSLGPTWGLHLIDVNIALGNLVTLVHDQSIAWLDHHHTR